MNFDNFARAQRNYDRYLPEDNRTDEEIENDAIARIAEEEAAANQARLLAIYHRNSAKGTQ